MSALTVSDIFVRVQRAFGDESGVQVTEEDCLRWINDAQREVVMQHAGLLMKEGFIDTESGTAEYTLPTDCFTLNFVGYRDSTTSSYYSLRWLPESAMNQYANGWDGNDFSAAYPQVYMKDTNDKIILFPRPDRSVASGIKLTYARYPIDLTDAEDAIDLPFYYHSYVEHFCMMKAYEKDEDWESADRKAQLVQSTIDFNNHRESWFGRETYPSVTPILEDYWE